MKTLRLEYANDVLRVWLNRPHVRNALDEVLIAELTETFETFPVKFPNARCVMLGGEGEAFCAGADLQWMQRSVQFSEAENRDDAQKLARMFEAIDQTPLPVVARVHGSALGGALGLIACCDVVVATENTRFGFTEAKLGLAPAVIAPFVLRKIGISAARRYFLTAELFEGDAAKHISLVHTLVEHEWQLEIEIQNICNHFAKCGPNALATAKGLIAQCDAPDFSARTIETIAQLRVSVEGQEGLNAFLQKRPAAWV